MLLVFVCLPCSVAKLLLRVLREDACPDLFAACTTCVSASAFRPTPHNASQVASLGEVHLALRVDFKLRNVVFDSPCQTRADQAFALERDWRKPDQRHYNCPVGIFSIGSVQVWLSLHAKLGYKTTAETWCHESRTMGAALTRTGDKTPHPKVLRNCGRPCSSRYCNKHCMVAFNLKTSGVGLLCHTCEWNSVPAASVVISLHGAQYCAEYPQACTAIFDNFHYEYNLTTSGAGPHSATPCCALLHFDGLLC